MLTANEIPVEKVYNFLVAKFPEEVISVTNDPKITVSLYNEIIAAKNIDAVLNNNIDEIVSGKVSLYLEQLLIEKGLSKSEVIKRTELDTCYAYQIFSGLKNPSRDKLLQIIFGFPLDLEEAQRVLAVFGAGALYPRIRRDAIVIFALSRGLDVRQTNELLYQKGEKVLFGE